ncbi:MAG: hypothetical protein GTO45_19980, partial [Candidatus Aminicenantes bacterium]|nr:hypothetical protein [Candidatus Aminicenantes bacterium]NIM81073.1 hypothetical protein [Candidatus Aminicenantes bacterium]NIN20450.1 hypothetical protein [Candidatus Aminicenantes bacterium]NIN44223.1 hypothetical protein [Candidatus Aminicenantes bacterium]NIN87041.1 hypothetical protein [Candidatus Aminicenantes bacterium]
MSLPLENLDNKTFEQLVEEAKKRIPIYAPQWTDHNLHDPGITLIELFAWLTEMQIYRLNRVTEKSYQTFFKLIGTTGKEEARKDLKTITRAVTNEDYETLAKQAPGLRVRRVKAIPRFHTNMEGEVSGVVTVAAASESYLKGEPEPEDDFLETLLSYLDGFRMLTTRVYVTLPELVEVSVKAMVFIKSRYLKDAVEERVVKALAAFLDPLTGGASGNGWPFGRPVYISEIYEVIDGVDGVDHVETGTISLRKENQEWQNSDMLIPRH